MAARVRAVVVISATALAAAAMCAGAREIGAQEALGRRSVADARVVGRSEAMGSVISAALDERGNVYVLDPDNKQILKFSEAGALLWRRGRSGGGPGEYSLPSRIAVDRRGHVFVWDLVKQTRTELDSSGTYVTLHRFAPAINISSRIVILPDWRFVVSGYAEFSRGADRAVHVYSSELIHQRSFGELPPRGRSAHADDHARMWGVGSVTPGPDGTVYSARKIPYEIDQYRADGTLVRRTVGPVAIRKTSDDAFVTRQSGDRFVTTSSADVSFPLPALALGAGYFITGVVQNAGTSRHLFSAAVTFIGPVTLPAEWGGLIGYDERRGILWGYGEIDLEPVLFRASARIVGPELHSEVS